MAFPREVEQLIDKNVEREVLDLLEDIACHPMEGYDKDGPRVEGYVTRRGRVDRLLLYTWLMHYLRLRITNIATGETERYI